jgi:hypothetical protein
MKHFYLRYCGSYAAAYALLFAALLVSGMAEKPSSGPLLFLCPVLAPLLPAYIFLRDNGRAPDMQEAKKFGYGIFVILFCIVMALTFVIYPPMNADVNMMNNTLMPALINIALFSVIGQFLFWGLPKLKMKKL